MKASATELSPAHIEEPELYVQPVLDFLQRVESISQLL